jgi:limonene-1,2-epoxide hydrolase
MTMCQGVTVLAPYAGVIEFKGDKIIGWRDYVDTGVIAASESGNAPSKQVTELISRAAV